MTKKPLILLSNDDGVQAKGLNALAKVLRKVGRVIIVAPDQQRSAASHSITLHLPLRINKLKKDVYSVSGTPTDCIMLAINEVLDERPDIIVSGINHGPNLGDDVHYSGTVAVAYEGGIMGIPSVAASLVRKSGKYFNVAADVTANVVKKVLKEGLPKGIILNVNVPDVPKKEIRGYKYTKQGKRDYGDIIVERLDPKGRVYYWIGGDDAGLIDIDGSDCNAVRDNFISITPLRVDITDRATLKKISKWKL